MACRRCGRLDVVLRPVGGGVEILQFEDACHDGPMDTPADPLSSFRRGAWARLWGIDESGGLHRARMPDFGSHRGRHGQFFMGVDLTPIPILSLMHVSLTTTMRNRV